MVAALIRKKYSIRLAPNSVGRLLAQLGITCQKPLHRALERDEALVQKWLKTEYPKIKKMAQTLGAEIYFGDAAHISVRTIMRGAVGARKAKRRLLERPGLAMP